MLANNNMYVAYYIISGLSLEGQQVQCSSALQERILASSTRLPGPGVKSVDIKGWIYTEKNPFFMICISGVWMQG